jgi:hypothetical protein
MMPEKTQEMEKWVKTWQTANISLKEIKKKELRAPDYYEKNLKILDEMLQYACENAKVRLSSGLMEQQHFFMKINRQKSFKKKDRS